MTNDQNENALSRGEHQYLLSISQTARACGVGRSTIYNEMNSGRLHSLRVGRRRLIPSYSIDKWLQGLSANDNGGGAASNDQKKTPQENGAASDDKEDGSQARSQAADAFHAVTRTDPGFSELCKSPEWRDLIEKCCKPGMKPTALVTMIDPETNEIERSVLSSRF